MTERVRTGWMAMNEANGMLAPHYGVERTKAMMEGLLSLYQNTPYKAVRVRIEVVQRKKRATSNKSAQCFSTEGEKSR